MIEHADPWWVNAAWHEAGHAVLLRKFGFSIRSIKLVGKGRNTHGVVQVSLGKVAPDKRNSYLIASAAGVESALIAKSKYSTPISIADIEYGGGEDRRNFNSFRTNKDIDLATARKQARALLMSNWGQVDLIATKLVRKGSC